MKYVLDASVAARWFITEESHPHADAVLEKLLREPDLFAVPELFFFEVFAVLARTHPRPEETYRAAFLPLVEGGVFRHPMTESLAAASAPFLSQGLTGYDSCYAGLAEELGASWITFDSEAHRRIAERKVSVDLSESLPADW